jgi:hypothetical protein
VLTCLVWARVTQVLHGTSPSPSLDFHTHTVRHRIPPRVPHPRDPTRNPPRPSPLSDPLHHAPLYPALGPRRRRSTRGVSQVGRSVLLGCAQAHAGLSCVRGVGGRGRARGFGFGGRGARRVRGMSRVTSPLSLVVDSHSQHYARAEHPPLLSGPQRGLSRRPTDAIPTTHPDRGDGRMTVDGYGDIPRIYIYLILC